MLIHLKILKRVFLYLIFLDEQASIVNHKFFV